MTPIFDEEINVIWGDYFGIIWHLNIQSGCFKQLFNCNDERFGSLRTSPLLVDNWLIFGTLLGIFFAIDKVGKEEVFVIEIHIIKFKEKDKNCLL